MAVSKNARSGFLWNFLGDILVLSSTWQKWNAWVIVCINFNVTLKSDVIIITNWFLFWCGTSYLYKNSWVALWDGRIGMFKLRHSNFLGVMLGLVPVPDSEVAVMDTHVITACLCQRPDKELGFYFQLSRHHVFGSPARMTRPLQVQRQKQKLYVKCSQLITVRAISLSLWLLMVV